LALGLELVLENLFNHLYKTNANSVYKPLLAAGLRRLVLLVTFVHLDK